MNLGNPRLFAKVLATVFFATFSVAVLAAWQTVDTEPGRRVEIDRESIIENPDGTLTAKGRVVLDRPVVDPRTQTYYSLIEIESRYNCAERTRTTLKRAYYKEDNSVLRYDDVQGAFELPVRSSAPDSILLHEVCRPSVRVPVEQPFGKTLDRVNELAADVRKANEALIEQAVRKEQYRPGDISAQPLPGTRRTARPTNTRDRADARRTSYQSWAYEGIAGPERWSELGPDYALCANGRRQSPIDLSGAFAVDLEAIQFFYPPTSFGVVDAGRHLQLTVHGGGIQTLGKSYRLIYVRFHNPSEYSIDGRIFDMEAQLVHRAEDGKQAIVSVLLEEGGENPVIQAALNNLPLEQGGETTSPGYDIDLDPLFPADRGYFTFMGSLTMPPCTEDVLWMVLKEPQQVSAEQLAMFQRLYRPNARPAQPAFRRIIKKSR